MAPALTFCTFLSYRNTLTEAHAFIYINSYVYFSYGQVLRGTNGGVSVFGLLASIVGGLVMVHGIF